MTESKAGLDDFLLLRRDLGHLSVVPTLEGTKFRASFRRQGDQDYIVAEHENIVIAIMQVISPRRGETIEGMTADINDWIGVLAEAERKRKQPYPHQTVEELVEKLPESRRVRRRVRRADQPKDNGYDLI